MTTSEEFREEWMDGPHRDTFDASDIIDHQDRVINDVIKALEGCEKVLEEREDESKMLRHSMGLAMDQRDELREENQRLKAELMTAHEAYGGEPIADKQVAEALGMEESRNEFEKRILKERTELKTALFHIMHQGDEVSATIAGGVLRPDTVNDELTKKHELVKENQRLRDLIQNALKGHEHGCCRLCGGHR